MGGVVGGNLLLGSVEDDAGLLVVAHAAVLVSVLLDDGEDDLALGFLTEADEPILLAKSSFPNSGLESLLCCGSFRQQFGGEAGGKPLRLERRPLDSGVRKGPPDQVSEMEPGRCQDGLQLLKRHGLLLCDAESGT